MIEIGQFAGGYAYRVFAPGNSNAKGQLDEFDCFCDTLMQAAAIEGVRNHVARRPKPAHKAGGKWNGPLTPWWFGIKREGATTLEDVTPA